MGKKLLEMQHYKIFSMGGITFLTEVFTEFSMLVFSVDLSFMEILVRILALFLHLSTMIGCMLFQIFGLFLVLLFPSNDLTVSFIISVAISSLYIWIYNYLGWGCYLIFFSEIYGNQGNSWKVLNIFYPGKPWEALEFHDFWRIVLDCPEIDYIKGKGNSR